MFREGIPILNFIKEKKNSQKLKQVKAVIIISQTSNQTVTKE